MPEIPELNGRIGDDVVQLRAISEWDIPEILIAHQDDTRMHRRLGARKPPSGAQLGMEVERSDDERRAGRRVSLTLVEPGQDYCRGRIDVHAIDWEAGRAELGIWVAPKFRGHGFARRALRHAARWLFDVVGLGELVLVTESDNEPMRRAAAAAGFTDRGAVDRAPDQIALVLTRAARGD